jgi:hypothetical protein
MKYCSTLLFEYYDFCIFILIGLCIFTYKSDALVAGLRQRETNISSSHFRIAFFMRGHMPSARYNLLFKNPYSPGHVHPRRLRPIRCLVTDRIMRCDPAILRFYLHPVSRRRCSPCFHVSTLPRMAGFNAPPAVPVPSAESCRSQAV